MFLYTIVNIAQSPSDLSSQLKNGGLKEIDVCDVIMNVVKPATEQSIFAFISCLTLFSLVLIQYIQINVSSWHTKRHVNLCFIECYWFVCNCCFSFCFSFQLCSQTTLQYRQILSVYYKVFLRNRNNAINIRTKHFNTTGEKSSYFEILHTTICFHLTSLFSYLIIKTIKICYNTFLLYVNSLK